MGRVFASLTTIVVAVMIIAIATIDSWLTWGERGQGAYPQRTVEEQANAEKRARAAEAEAIRAADEAEKFSQEVGRVQEKAGDGH